MRANDLPLSMDRRKDLVKKLKEKHPQSIPVILKASNQKTLPEVSKTKFLVPSEVTLGKLKLEILKFMTLRPKDTVHFSFQNGLVFPCNTTLISTIYEKHKSEDGFLYVIYSVENVFG